MNIVLAMLVINGLFFVMPTISKFRASLTPARTIIVSAQGKTTVIPDIASTSFSVVTEGKNPKDITSENSRKLNSAIDFIKSQGIEAKYIKTIGYNLSPRYEYDKNKRASFISGYTLTQTVSVKIRDFAKIGEILGALPTYGVNQISSINFDVEDSDKYLNEARKEAFDKALAKARTMARQNNVRIKRAVTFSESQNVYPYPILFASQLSKGMEAAAVSPSIEPGSQEVTVMVSVTYEIQ